MDPNTSLAHLETSEWTGRLVGSWWRVLGWLVLAAGTVRALRRSIRPTRAVQRLFWWISDDFQTVSDSSSPRHSQRIWKPQSRWKFSWRMSGRQPSRRGRPAVALRGVRCRYSDFWWFQTVSDSLQTVFRQFLSSSAKIRTSDATDFFYGKATPLS